MLELFLSAIDRILTLLRGRVESRKRVLADVLAPIFDDLCKIHNDYVKVISQARTMLDVQIGEKDYSGFSIISEYEARPIAYVPPADIRRKYTEALRLAQRTIHERRLEYESVRIKVQGFAEGIRDSLPSKAELVFVESVLKYFPERPANIRATPASLKTSTHRDFLPTVLSDFKSAELFLSSVEQSVIENLVWDHPEDLTRCMNAAKALDALIIRKNKRWMIVCNAYASLRVELGRAG